MTNGSVTGSLNKAREENVIRVLLIEDNAGDARLIQEMLKDTGKIDMLVETAGTLSEGLKYVGNPEKSLDAVLLDLGLPDSQGFETFERFQQEAESFTTIILSGLNDVDLALHAVRQGAQDYLVKGQISSDVLLRAIRHAIERDETDRLLRESQERYQSLVDRMPDAIVVHRGGDIVFVNPAAVKLLGATSPDDLVGRKIIDNIHPDFKEIVVERIRSAHVDSQVQPNLEEKFVRMDGKVIDVEVTGTPFSFEGQPATQVIIRDITERKQRERELEVVASVSRSLRQADSLEEILPIVLDQALASIGADEGTITLVQPGTGDHLIAMGRGARELPIGKIIPSGKGLTSVVVETGKPYVSNDFRNNPDPRTVRVIDIQPTEALAIVPIAAKNHVIGTLGIGKNSPFEESDIRVLSAICNIGGSAIHRAELFDQTERRLRHLNSLREIDTAIASSLDLAITLDVILAQASQELAVHASSILLLNNEQNLLYAAGRGFESDWAKSAKVKFGEGLAGRVAMERALMEKPVLGAIANEPDLNRMIESEGFVSYYGAPLIAKGRVIGVLETFHRSDVERDREWKNFLLTLAGQAAIAIDNATLFQDLQSSNQDLRLAYDRTIEGWAHALALRDMETVEHSRRVTDMTLKLARALGMSEENLVHVRRGALLHDIGKMSIPDRILGKTGPLDDDEWIIMRKHPEYAGQMLSGIQFLHPALPIPTGHHEKWDGTGYPRGLKGKHIPLEARIFSVIDVWDALTSDRPYRKAWSEEKARAHLLEQSGKHFDPDVVEAFFQYIVK